MKKSAIFAVLVLIGSSSILCAHDWPCQQDAEKFCKDVQPGEGRIMECMKGHKDELSQGCKDMFARKMSEYKGKPKDGSGAWACQEDAKKFCKDVQPGEGRLIKCLDEHKGDLSQACTQMFAQKKQERKAKETGWSEACGKDAETLCKDVAPGQGRIGDCLHEHMSQVSQGCKDFHESKKPRGMEKN
jgi:Golgi apparatus protein 1